MTVSETLEFAIDGKPLFCSPYGSGHINATYLVLDDTARLYILQKINQNVFRDVGGLMSNINLCCRHLEKKGLGFREALKLIPTKSGEAYHVNESGDAFRMYAFVSDSTAFQVPRLDIMEEAGLAVGRFLGLLSDFGASRLTETIPYFHNTPKRFVALAQAVESDAANRAAQAKPEIEFAMKRAGFASALTSLQESGELPTRVTHNDTKLNNILFDRESLKALCVIDLDTIMPGLVAYDFGDAIRTGANTAEEDERDLAKVQFSLELYHAYAKGFMGAFGERLTESEKKHLPTGAKMMTFECGIRFLTDYLSGDTYFKSHREKHNLDRCRTQFKLVEEMERNWDKMSLQP